MMISLGRSRTDTRCYGTFHWEDILEDLSVGGCCQERKQSCGKGEELHLDGLESMWRVRKVCW